MDWARCGRYGEAVSLYTKSIQRWGRDPAAYTNRALCRLRSAEALGARVGAAETAKTSGGDAGPRGRTGADGLELRGADGSMDGAEQRAALLEAARADCDAAVRLDAGFVRAYERRGARWTRRMGRETGHGNDILGYALC